MIIIGGANLRKEGTKLAIIISTKDSNEKYKDVLPFNEGIVVMLVCG